MTAYPLEAKQCSTTTMTSSGFKPDADDPARVRNVVFPGWDDGVEISELRAARDWLKSFVRDDWDVRVKTIRTEVARLAADPNSASTFSFRDDSANWYLYLTETYVERPQETEPHQCARILPVVQALGRNIERLSRVPGVDRRLERLFADPHASADAVLFELLVAACYARAGAKVEMLPEAATAKTPDLAVTDQASTFFVECKRLVPRSQRDIQESQKWAELWRHLREELVRQRLGVVLAIDFRADILTLRDDFLLTRLAALLPLVARQGTIVDDSDLSVGIRFVNLELVRRTFTEERYIKCGSAAEQELIAGVHLPTLGWSSAIVGRTGSFGASENPLNSYWDSVDFACGAYWNCSHERSVSAKARDVRKRLAEATAQLPGGSPGVVHIGVECLDAAGTQDIRLSRIDETMKKFDFGTKDVRAVFCHFLQPSLPPDKNWDFIETVVPFRRHPDWSHGSMLTTVPADVLTNREGSPK